MAGAEGRNGAVFDLQFDSSRLKQLQEEMITAYSNLINALKEAESEQEYMWEFWKGEAAEQFIRSQNDCFGRLVECSKRTEELLLSLGYAEECFRACEKKVSKIIGEKCIWEM